ncbi:MAG: hypothetical protein KF780_13425 [Sphingomonas sp.]|nr:hypothetical protein [Sphingomonas sp.]
MANIGRNWNGHVYGTNTGNVAVTLEGEDDALTGVIRLSDNQHGLAVYDVTGQFEAGKLALTGTPQGQPPEGVELGELTVAGALTPEGRIDGEWSTAIGTGGTFQLWPHSYQVRPTNPGAVAEQLNTSTRPLGAVRLYADDVRSLIAQLVKDFSQKRAVVTYHDKGIEKNIYSDEFEQILDDLPELRYLKIFVGEPEIYGLQRNATVELAAWGDNAIRVQSVQEAWAIGKAEALAQHVHGFQRKLATQFRNFGLTFNVIILVAALAALPGLPTFWQRLAFLGSAFGIQALIAYFHRQYVPNFVFYPAKKKASWIGRLGPGFLSWGITIFGGVVAAIIYGILKGELDGSPLARFISGLFQ